ncbi:protein BANP isoform X5 [Stegostoma tigrinum]|uniref:protein BANP isoform X5 n=1 Tax=Stegostoma tigrinum TaxID=3053191 RepID=UPI00202B0B87|nr:protein BANP isoform X5 [Stegostoma tigrinum]
MMSEHNLTDVVQIAVDDLTQDQAGVLDNHQSEDGIEQPAVKRQRVDIANGQSIQDSTVKSILFDINQAICLRLDSIEAKIQAVEATCKAIEEKIDLVFNKQNSPIQVPMVAGSPLGATQTWNKVRSTVPQTTVILNSDRQNPIGSKVAGQEEPLARGTDTLDNILSNSVPGRRQNTIIVKVPGHEDSHTEDVESGSETSDTVSNSGQSGGQNLAPNVTLITLNSEGGMQGSVSSSGDLQQNQAQTLHYALANAQQVHIHRIGEDGQVQQVAVQGHLHIAQVPQGEQVQITQDSEGNLQIHQVHVSQDGQVLQGAQLIAVASAEHPSSGVDGSPLQGSDIQVQYVQLAPVTDHNAASQGTESLAATIQPEMQIEHGAIQIQQGENGEVVQIQMPVNTVSS